jgi:hypothetical protein
MSLFGPPNVKNLIAKRDVKGLIKALGYEKAASVRRDAVDGLLIIGGAQAIEAVVAAFDAKLINSDDLQL